MRTLMLAFALLGASPVQAQQAAPSAAIVALRDRFEVEVLAVEGSYGTDVAGLYRAASEIAERVYGGDWDAVRTEAQRSLAALPTIDLTPYANLEPARPFADKQRQRDLLPIIMLVAHGEKWDFAAMRFWDAQVVAYSIAPTAAPPNLEQDTGASLGAKIGLVPPRAYRGRRDGADVLAIRYWRSLVVIPYSLNPDGLIVPDLDGVLVYPLRH